MDDRFDLETVPPDSYRWGKFPESTQLDSSTGLPKLIPLWVADMDFDVAEPIQVAMSRYLSYSRFGYATTPASLAPLICERLSLLYEWQVDPEWLVMLPGVVPGLYASTLAYTQPDQQVLFPLPIYHHLHLAAAMFGRPQQAIPQRRDASQGFSCREMICAMSVGRRADFYFSAIPRIRAAQSIDDKNSRRLPLLRVRETSSSALMRSTPI